MFGLSEAHFNAVKRQAAKLNEEYSKLPQKQRKDEKQVAALISKMWEPVFAIISRDRFCWVAGYIKGRVGHDENGQSLYE